MENAHVGTELENDPRWRPLHDRSWVCPCCGETHAGLFDLACDHSALGSEDSSASFELDGFDLESFFVGGFPRAPQPNYCSHPRSAKARSIPVKAGADVDDPEDFRIR
jgi:hypothetical protein